jgi:hypothetical protein
MVSFRYHVVSLSAVLAALAAGVVLGAAREPAGAPAAVTATSSPGADQESFLTAVTPRLLDGALADQKVVLLLAPDSQPGRLAAALEQAGATVTGTLRLRPTLLDPAAKAAIDDVVVRVLPPDLATPTGSALARAAAVLAAGLTGDDDVRDSVVGGFTGGDLLGGQAPEEAATLVLLVGGPGSVPLPPVHPSRCSARAPAG